MARKILFLHIPKTAGTALRMAMEEQYTQTQRAWCYDNRPEVVQENVEQAVAQQRQVIAGHVDFSMLTSEMLRHYEVLCFFRHPADRCISQYLFVRESPWEIHQQRAEEWGSFEGYLQTADAHNFQSRRLTGWREGRRVDPELLEAKALQNLAQIKTVGLVEHYRESVMYIAIRYRWNTPAIRKHNRGPAPEEAQELKERYGSQLEVQNKVDLKLYRAAERKFKKQLTPFWKLRKSWYKLRQRV